MKFLIATNHSYMLWQFRKELIAKLLERGEVVLSMPFVGHESDFENMGCRCVETDIDRRGVNPIKDARLYKYYKALLKMEKPDIVITYSIKPNIYMGRACQKLKITYLVNVQGLGTAFQKQPIATFVTFMYRHSLKNAKKVFFENTENGDEFLRRKIVPKDKIAILNGAGVNLDEYALKEYPSSVETRFLFLGRIMKEKGVDEFFEAAEYFKNNTDFKNVLFDVVGPFEDEYKEKVDKLVKDGVINYYGFQKDPKPYYANAHCVVLPSYHEGMSNVLLEASSTGRPIITSNIPGCREVVDDGITGYLCLRKNSASLIDCMEKFLSLSSEAKKEMGLKARAKVEQVFDKRKVVEDTVNYIIR